MRRAGFEMLCLHFLMASDRRSPARLTDSRRALASAHFGRESVSRAGADVGTLRAGDHALGLVQACGADGVKFLGDVRI